MNLSVNTIDEARSLKLRYVRDAQPGITRKRQGKNFVYTLHGKAVRDKATLERIRKLVIPPAWESVWICPSENGHLQATGYDVRGRKQYRYHTKWNEARNETKFHRLNEFGKALEKIRARVKKDLSLPGLPLNKVLATVITLMDMTGIRIGNNEYEKLYGSYGLSTMKDKHVTINGAQLRFAFKGKKGVQHEITVRNQKLAKIVKQCRDIPGSELFQYRDENGVRHSIDSGMVNAYIHEIAGADFTSKDFRTWNGTVYAFTTLREMAAQAVETNVSKQLLTMFDAVAKKLGNTRAVCKKYYVHPAIVQLHESNQLVKTVVRKSTVRGLRHLHADEQQLICTLQKMAA